MSDFRAAVELRDGGDDSPGRLTGVLMRYGSPGVHGRESFAPGSLRWPDNGIRIDHEHASSPARGSVQPPSHAGGSVRIGRWDRSKNRRGRYRIRQAAPRLGDPDAVRSAGLFGIVGGVQIGNRQSYTGGRRVITDAILRGAGLVGYSQLPGYLRRGSRRQTEPPPPAVYLVDGCRSHGCNQ